MGRSFLPRRSVFRLRHVAQVHSKRHRKVENRRLKWLKKAKKLEPKIKLDENLKDVDAAAESCAIQDELISYETHGEFVETEIPEDLLSCGEARTEIPTANNNCWSPARKILADYPVAALTKPARSPQRVKWRGKQSCSTKSLVSISKYIYKSTIENAGKLSPVRDPVTSHSILRNPLSAARQEHGMGKLKKKKKNRIATKNWHGQEEDELVFT